MPKLPLNGALLLNKPQDISSFGVIDELKKALLSTGTCRRSDLPKLGHGGTLDPFATGLLVVLTGDACKLARYFLHSTKGYRGIIRFGETTVPGDPTAPISERSDVIPDSIGQLQEIATKMTAQPYLQTPPMHSAKKHQGKPLYELAREGVEVEREAKLLKLYDFKITSYTPPHASFELLCSSGTYVRTLAQDFARLMGTVALLETLDRTRAGVFELSRAWPMDRVLAETREGRAWDEFDCWIPFNRLMDGFERAEATQDEARALANGQQNVLLNILHRQGVAPAGEVPMDRALMTIFYRDRLLAISRNENALWRIERVFPDALEA